MITAVMTGARAFGFAKPSTDYVLVVKLTPEDYQTLLPLGSLVPYRITPNCSPWHHTLRFEKLVLLCCIDDEEWVAWQQFNSHVHKLDSVNRKQVERIYSKVFDHDA